MAVPPSFVSPSSSSSASCNNILSGGSISLGSATTVPSPVAKRRRVDLNHYQDGFFLPTTTTTTPTNNVNLNVNVILPTSTPSSPNKVPSSSHLPIFSSSSRHHSSTHTTTASLQSKFASHMLSHDLQQSSDNTSSFWKELAQQPTFQPLVSTAAATNFAFHPNLTFQPVFDPFTANLFNGSNNKQETASVEKKQPTSRLAVQNQQQQGKKERTFTAPTKTEFAEVDEGWFSDLFTDPLFEQIMSGTQLETPSSSLPSSLSNSPVVYQTASLDFNLPASNCGFPSPLAIPQQQPLRVLPTTKKTYTKRKTPPPSWDIMKEENLKKKEIPLHYQDSDDSSSEGSSLAADADLNSPHNLFELKAPMYSEQRKSYYSENRYLAPTPVICLKEIHQEQSQDQIVEGSVTVQLVNTEGKRLPKQLRQLLHPSNQHSLQSLNEHLSTPAFLLRIVESSKGIRFRLQFNIEYTLITGEVCKEKVYSNPFVVKSLTRRPSN